MLPRTPHGEVDPAPLELAVAADLDASVQDSAVQKAPEQDSPVQQTPEQAEPAPEQTDSAAPEADFPEHSSRAERDDDAE